MSKDDWVASVMGELERRRKTTPPPPSQSKLLAFLLFLLVLSPLGVYVLVEVLR